MVSPRRLRMEFDVGNYKQKDVNEPEPPKHRKRAKRSANPFIDAEAGVNGEASGDEKSDDKNYNLDKFIAADVVEF